MKRNPGNEEDSKIKDINEDVNKGPSTREETKDNLKNEPGRRNDTKDTLNDEPGKKSDSSDNLKDEPGRKNDTKNNLKDHTIDNMKRKPYTTEVDVESHSEDEGINDDKQKKKEKKRSREAERRSEAGESLRMPICTRNEEFKFKLTDEELKKRQCTTCPVHGIPDKGSITKREIIIINVFVFIVIAIIASFFFVYKYISSRNKGVTSADESTTLPNIWDDYRLPPFIAPEHYEVSLNTSIAKLFYEGIVIISFHVLKKSKFIVLHQAGFINIELKLKENDVDLKILEKRTISSNEQMQIDLYDFLKTNITYNLHIKFSGHLAREGFYFAQYSKSSRGKRYVLFTNTQRMDTRRVFPCFDEPAMTATFQLSITHWTNHTAYSNTKATKKNSNNKEICMTKFNKTEKMSTYRFGFVIISGRKEISKIVVGINVTLVVPEEMDNNKYKSAFDLIFNLIFKRFNSRFKINFPFPMLDIILAPADFNSVSDKWGLIIYGPLLRDFTDYSINRSENLEIIISISQVLAQQWLENLVNIKWWSEIWLNRGLITFLKWDAIGSIDSNMRDYVVSRDRILALISDSSTYATALNAEVSENIDIHFIQSPIFNYKGACLIQMLVNVLGKDKFDKGVQNFLQTHKHGIVKTEDLWISFKKVAPDLDIPEIMHSWVHNNSYPVVYANYTNNLMKLHQTCFRDHFFKMANISSPCTSKWFIPITYQISSDKKVQTYWLNRTDGEIRFTSKFQWIKLNVQAVGFYRIMYNEDLWKTLIDRMHEYHRNFSMTDRSNLLDDAFVLASVKVLSMHYALNLSKYLINEVAYRPWNTAVHHFKDIYNNLKILQSETKSKLKFTEFAVTLMKPRVLSIESDCNDKKQPWNGSLYPTLIEAMKALEEQNVTKNAKDCFQKWKEGKTVPVNLRTHIYNTGVKFGDRNDWNHVKSKFDNETDNLELKLLLRAMAQTKDDSQINQFLEDILPSKKVTVDMELDAILTLTKDSMFRKKVGDRIVEKFDILINMCNNDYSKLFVLSESLSNLNQQEQYDSLEPLVSIQSKNFEKLFNHALEKILKNVFWIKNVKPSIVEWLNQNGGNTF